MIDYKTTMEKINKLAEISLNLANYIDREGEKDISEPISNHLHMGYRALSRYLRDGVKACIDIQEMYAEAKSNEDNAKTGEKEARDFLFECFGDEEIDTINDEDKARIISFCKQIEKNGME